MKVYLTVILMALVTYIPRVLPMGLLKMDKLPSGFKKFLYFIPYAALGALIFPGGLTAISGNVPLSAMAIILTIVISFFVENIVFVVFSSILVVYFLLKM